MKLCERCNKPIPEDYVNLLCDECYRWLEAENTRIAQERTITPPPTPESETALNAPIHPQNGSNFGILDPNYRENPQKEDKEQWEANFAIFAKNTVLLWKPTRQMYEFIKTECLNRIQKHPQYPKFIWKPKIVDVGCGTGVGSNILSQEADFVWGIDKNKKTLEFARQAFTREKNGIYYSSQVTFDNIDFMEETRELMQFDVIVAIEVIEHIYDTHKFLTKLITKFSKKNKDGSYNAVEPSIFFFSTPNRNNKTIMKEGPKNAYHVREWRSEEFYNLLSQYFGSVKFYSAAGVPIEGYSTEHTPLLAECQNPKI